MVCAQALQSGQRTEFTGENLPAWETSFVLEAGDSCRDEGEWPGFRPETLPWTGQVSFTQIASFRLQDARNSDVLDGENQT
jgi:hypothetical protein